MSQSLELHRSRRQVVRINGKPLYSFNDGTLNIASLLGPTVVLKSAYGGAELNLAPDGTTIAALPAEIIASDDPSKGQPTLLADPHGGGVVRIYCRNVDENTSDQTFCDYFSQFGTVVDVSSKSSSIRQHRGGGIAFVSFLPLRDASGLFGPYCHRIQDRNVYVQIANAGTDRRLRAPR